MNFCNKYLKNNNMACGSEDGIISYDNILFSQDDNYKSYLALKKRKILINEDITENTTASFLYFVNKIQEKDNVLLSIEEITELPEINILVNTNGGYSTECFAIVDIIEQLKNIGYTVNTINIAKAYSAGFPIAVCGTNRYCYERAEYMLHDVSYGTVGKLRDVEESVVEAQRIRDKYCDIIYKYTKIPGEIVRSCIESKRDMFIDSNEMLVYEGCDKIL